MIMFKSIVFSFITPIMGLLNPKGSSKKKKKKLSNHTCQLILSNDNGSEALSKEEQCLIITLAKRIMMLFDVAFIHFIS